MERTHKSTCLNALSREETPGNAEGLHRMKTLHSSCSQSLTSLTNDKPNIRNNSKTTITSQHTKEYVSCFQLSENKNYTNCDEDKLARIPAMDNLIERIYDVPENIYLPVHINNQECFQISSNEDESYSKVSAERLASCDAKNNCIHACNGLNVPSYNDNKTFAISASNQCSERKRSHTISTNNSWDDISDSDAGVYTELYELVARENKILTPREHLAFSSLNRTIPAPTHSESLDVMAKFTDTTIPMGNSGFYITFNSEGLQNSHLSLVSLGDFSKRQRATQASSGNKPEDTKSKMIVPKSKFSVLDPTTLNATRLQTLQTPNYISREEYAAQNNLTHLLKLQHDDAEVEPSSDEFTCLDCLGQTKKITLNVFRNTAKLLKLQNRVNSAASKDK